MNGADVTHDDHARFFEFETDMKRTLTYIPMSAPWTKWSRSRTR